LTLEKELVDLGFLDYVAARIMADVAHQREEQEVWPLPFHQLCLHSNLIQSKSIANTTETLPSAESREHFIRSLPPPEASSHEISEWLWSWLDEFDFKGKDLKAETTINNLGLDGATLRKAILEDRTFMVGALHLRNGFSWNHMFGIAEDVREALKREERNYHERRCVGDCGDMICMLHRSEGSNGNPRKRKLDEALPFNGGGEDFRKTKAAREISYNMDEVTYRYDCQLDRTHDMEVEKSAGEKLYNVEEVTSRYGSLLDQASGGVDSVKAHQQRRYGWRELTHRHGSLLNKPPNYDAK
jgi:hypothetical protein